MPHKFSDYVLDNGLVAFEDATVLHFLSRDPLTYANVGTYSLGSMSPTSFSELADAEDGNGRQTTLAASMGVATANGFATDWAVVDSANQRLLANGELDEPVVLVNGENFCTPNLTLRLPSH